MSQTEPNSVQLVEDTGILEIFASGVARVEWLSGGMVRIVFYVERMEDGKMVHAVVLKLVRPASTWPKALRIIASAMAMENGLPIVADGGKITLLDS